MTVSDRQLHRLGPWPQGINNLAREGHLPSDEDGNVLALREADNVDPDSGGRVRRRGGAERFLDGALTHSLWGVDGLPFGLFVDAGQLHALFPNESVEALGVVVGNLPLSYTLVNDRVLFSNTAVSGLLTLDLQCWPWAPEAPGGQPLVAAVPGFGLAAGRYQVAITFTDALGRESGSTLAAVIDLAGEQGISLTHVPQPLDPSTHSILVYVTDTNDSVLHLYGRLPVGATEVTISAKPQGRALATQFLAPLPAGQIVRAGHGRQFVARGNEIFWSEPLRYGLFNPATNRMRFSGRVDLLEPIGDGGPGAGVYVGAAGRTYWLGGADPAQFTQQIARAAGAVPGSAAVVAGDVVGLDSAAPVLVWLATDGYFCLGLPGGQIAPLKRGEAVVDGADRAAVLFREQDGISQLITALRAPQAHGLAVSDRAVAHVIRRDPEE